MNTLRNIDCQPQINGHNYLDAEYQAYRALLLAWRRMKPVERPRAPGMLARVLAGTFSWPFPDYPPSTARTFAMEDAADKLWRRIKGLTEAIASDLPSNTGLRLSAALADRLPDRKEQDAQMRIDAFDRALRGLDSVELNDRVRNNRPARTKDDYVTDFVRRVFSYLKHVEKVEPTIDFADDGGPVTRTALIVVESLKALRIPIGSALRNQMRKVKAETDWRDDPESWQYTLPNGCPIS